MVFLMAHCTILYILYIIFYYDSLSQLNRIINVVGSPSQEMLDKMTSESAKNYILNLPETPRKDFGSFLVGANPLAISMIEQMLELDPDKRVTAEQALAHPYLEQVTGVKEVGKEGGG